LCLQIACLAAIAAVVRSIAAKADFVQALAQDAVFLTRATLFFKIALRANEFFSHAAEFTPEACEPRSGKPVSRR
jgi:hypothetical protein